MTVAVLSKNLKFASLTMFEYQLVAFGLPILSKWSVLGHQFKHTLKANPGLWILLHLWFCSVRFVLKPLWYLFNVNDGDYSRKLPVVACLIGWAGLGTAIWYWGDESLALLLAVPAAILGLTLILMHIFPARGTTRALQYWNYVPARNYLRNMVSVPEHILKRYEVMQEHYFRNVEVYVLEFSQDPFLVAVEKNGRPWWFRSKVIVGAWNTHTPMDQI